jgi:hypothetical protein
VSEKTGGGKTDDRGFLTDAVHRVGGSKALVLNWFTEAPLNGSLQVFRPGGSQALLFDLSNFGPRNSTLRARRSSPPISHPRRIAAVDRTFERAWSSRDMVTFRTTFSSPAWPAQFSASPPLGSSLRTPCSRWSPKGGLSCPLACISISSSALRPYGF